MFKSRHKWINDKACIFLSVSSMIHFTVTIKEYSGNWIDENFLNTAMENWGWKVSLQSQSRQPILLKVFGKRCISWLDLDEMFKLRCWFVMHGSILKYVCAQLSRKYFSVLQHEVKIILWNSLRTYSSMYTFVYIFRSCFFWPFLL